jgi:hypothetical protein
MRANGRSEGCRTPGRIRPLRLVSLDRQVARDEDDRLRAVA